MPEALKYINAVKFAELAITVNNVYEQEHDKITKNMDGTLEGFSKSYEDNPLNEYFEEFFNLYKIEDLLQLQVNFIRTNKSEFVDN